MISTRDLSQLPSIPDLKRLLQSLATLDVIMSLDDGGAYYSFQSRWGRNQQVGQMENGSGDHLHAYFTSHGCFLKGFAHESLMSPYRVSPHAVWPGVLDGVPREFDAALRQPAFSVSDTTFAIWRLNGDASWQCGDIKFPEATCYDGSEEMLSILDGDPARYVRWAEEYYETKVNRTVVDHVYKHRPLTDDVITSLNTQASLGRLHNCFVQIDYPID